MSDMLASATDYLNTTLKSYVSQSVVYSRGVDTVTLSATLGRPDFGVDAADPMLESWNGKDFLFPAADLILDGSTVEPVRGDQIRVTSGSTTEVYQVMSPGALPEFRYSDPTHKRLRVHAKLVATE